MGLDTGSTAIDDAQTLGGFDLQQFRDQIFRFDRKRFGKHVLPMYDFAVRLHGVLIKKRWVAGQHFINQHAQRPPIHALAVPLTGHHLGGQVIWRAAQGPCAIIHHLGKAEIRHLDVPIGRDQPARQSINQSFRGRNGSNECRDMTRVRGKAGCEKSHIIESTAQALRGEREK